MKLLDRARGESARPLVAVLCSVPLLGEAMDSVLEFADVRSFNGRRDTVGLLRWLKPDAIVVDSAEDAHDAMKATGDRDVPVLHIGVRDRTLRLLRNGEWEAIGNGDGPTPEVIRNVLAGCLFARGAS